MRVIEIFISCVLLLFILSITLTVNAHDNSLNIEYDDCIVPRNENGSIDIKDGSDEMWYSLISHKVIQARHISETTTVIKYYFIDSSTLINGEKYTWTTDVSEEVANEIKQAYYNGTLIFYDKNNLPQTQ